MFRVYLDEACDVREYNMSPAHRSALCYVHGLEPTVLSFEFQSSLWLIATSSIPTFHSERELPVNIRLNVLMFTRRARLMHAGFPDEQPSNVTCIHQRQHQFQKTDLGTR